MSVPTPTDSRAACMRQPKQTPERAYALEPLCEPGHRREGRRHRPETGFRTALSPVSRVGQTLSRTPGQAASEAREREPFPGPLLIPLAARRDGKTAREDWCDDPRR